MGNKDSAYSAFAKDQVAEAGLLLSHDFILSKYVENALWPDLYPYKGWCDSVFVGAGYKSPKASYMAKAFSAILDYAYEYRLDLPLIVVSIQWCDKQVLPVSDCLACPVRVR